MTNKKEKKEKVIIDVYHDESGHEFYRVYLDDGCYDTPPNNLSGNGNFLNSYDIDDHTNEWEVIKDYRY